MAKKVASLYAEIGADTSGLERGLKKTSSSLDQIVAGATAAGVALKRGFDYASYGAGVRQTNESFDLLLESLDIAPGLFKELNTVSDGTISNLQLMSSTAALLAGTSTTLGQAMAGAAPELLEIARAANKLNPSLGTTTHMYESLALGIKRSSPLIIDNLGLTVKIGEANEKFAASLGKSVEELTAEELKMALLNETLAAGRVLIDQVGGSVDSSTDSFNNLQTSVTNTKDELASGFSRVFEPGVKIVDRFFDSLSSAMSAEEQIKVAADNGIITREKANELINDATWTTYTFADALSYVSEQERMATTETQGWNAAQMLLNETVSYSGNVHSTYAERAREAAQANIANAAATEQASAVTSTYNQRLQDAAGSYSTLSTNIYSVTQRLQDNLDFINAGGLALVSLASTAEEAMDAGDFEGAKLALDAAAQGAVDLDLELGKIDPSEAVTRLMDLGLGPEEAQAKVIEFENSLFAVTSKRWVVQVDMVVSGSGTLPPGVTVPGTGGPPSGPTNTGPVFDVATPNSGAPSGGGSPTYIIEGDVIVQGNSPGQFAAALRDKASARSGAGYAGSQ